MNPLGLSGRHLSWKIASCSKSHASWCLMMLDLLSVRVKTLHAETEQTIYISKITLLYLIEITETFWKCAPQQNYTIKLLIHMTERCWLLAHFSLPKSFYKLLFKGKSYEYIISGPCCAICIYLNNQSW